MLKMHKGISNISKDIDKNCSTKKYITFIYVAINFIFDFFKTLYYYPVLYLKIISITIESFQRSLN